MVFKIVGKNLLELEKEAILRESNIQLFVQNPKEEPCENLKGFVFFLEKII